MNTPAARPLLPDFPAAVWIFLGALIVALALVVHAIVPRYEWRTVDANGHAIVVYDRWSGRFQRAEWHDDSSVQGMSLWSPF